MSTRATAIPTQIKSGQLSLTAGLALQPCTVDTRLIARVQQRAARALCHQSANLISCYTITADVYRSRLQAGKLAAALAAKEQLQECEARLRSFLATCTLGSRYSLAGCHA